MNTASITFRIVALIAIGLVFSCNEKSKTVTSSPAPEHSTNNSLKKFRAELSTPQGSSAYSELHHRGAAGFEELLQAFANAEISPDNYISWSYDLETRWPDGPQLSEDFEKFQFERANEDEALAKSLGAYYSVFPQDFLEALKEKGPGAQKIATLALQTK